MVTEETRTTTDTCMSNVIELLNLAMKKGQPEKRAEIITEAQHFLAWALRSAMTECQEIGQSWRALGPKIGMPHNVLYRQYSAGAPVIATEPSYTPINVAVGFRTVGDVDDSWQLISVEDAADPGLKSVRIFFDPAVTPGGTPSPYAQQDVEFLYAPAVPDDLLRLGRAKPYPIWHPDLGRRPLHLAEAVFDELFGPPDMTSSERNRWEAEGQRRQQLRATAAHRHVDNR
ncbi:hypothetical protein [Kutzneria sp. NPDC051319]|uniref:hypothetical protein n=1 Tax=Kutzneria sp. NPDC051319 TaxID=3155047 RepID=UPI00343B89C4